MKTIRISPELVSYLKWDFQPNIDKKSLEKKEIFGQMSYIRVIFYLISSDAKTWQDGGQFDFGNASIWIASIVRNLSFPETLRP